ncbi:MAG: AlpA family phage regulatory protein [Candidatus Thiodiazotropha sp. 'RUGA']|nr:AlpA family phage regulatory protein [Candidatus Thiodiazotropha sp. 'RUGA']
MATQAHSKPTGTTTTEFPDSLYTEREVMAIANASRTSLNRWEKKGIFPPRRKVGVCSIRYKKSEVDEWVQNPQAWVDKYKPEQAA